MTLTVIGTNGTPFLAIGRQQFWTRDQREADRIADLLNADLCEPEAGPADAAAEVVEREGRQFVAIDPRKLRALSAPAAQSVTEAIASLPLPDGWFSVKDAEALGRSKSHLGRMVAMGILERKVESYYTKQGGQAASCFGGAGVMFRQRALYRIVG